MFDVQKSIELLKSDYYIDEFDTKEYQIVTSRFKNEAYNYIIPKVKHENLDLVSIEKYLSKYKQKGFKYSYYLNETLKNKYCEFLKKDNQELSYDDSYVYSEVKKRISIKDVNFVSVNKKNVNEFLNVAEICFPGWDNNEEFTYWCFESPYVEMIGIVKDSKIVSIGAYYSNDKSDYVLLMNDCTIPEYRKQGLHSKTIKIRINEVLKKKKKAFFYANVEKGEGSYRNYVKNGFKVGCQYFVYN